MPAAACICCHRRGNPQLPTHHSLQSLHVCSEAGIIAVPLMNLEILMVRSPRKHYSINFLNPDFTLAGSSCHWIVFSLLLKLNIISFNFNLKESSSKHITNLENLLNKQIVLLRLKWCPSLIPCTFKMAELQLLLPSHS